MHLKKLQSSGGCRHSVNELTNKHVIKNHGDFWKGKEKKYSMRVYKGDLILIDS